LTLHDVLLRVHRRILLISRGSGVLHSQAHKNVLNKQKRDGNIGPNNGRPINSELSLVQSVLKLFKAASEFLLACVLLLTGAGIASYSLKRSDYLLTVGLLLGFPPFAGGILLLFIAAGFLP
jgi:hypothetical protein